MIQTLLNSTPIARKEHICDFCGCLIQKGEKYRRQTNIYDGSVYDFVCHCDCHEVASLLDLYIDCDYDEGLTSEYFLEAIDQYIYDNHYDNEKDDIVKEWQGLSYIEATRKILNELNQEDNERDKAVNASTPHDATCNRL